jgi:hypothetical protein
MTTSTITLYPRMNEGVGVKFRVQHTGDLTPPVVVVASIGKESRTFYRVNWSTDYHETKTIFLKRADRVE